jgi:hypothetical protein
MRRSSRVVAVILAGAMVPAVAGSLAAMVATPATASVASPTRAAHAANADTVGQVVSTDAVGSAIPAGRTVVGAPIAPMSMTADITNGVRNSESACAVSPPIPSTVPTGGNGNYPSSVFFPGSRAVAISEIEFMICELDRTPGKEVHGDYE